MNGDRVKMKTEYCLGFYFNTEETSVILINKLRPDWQAGHLNGVGGKVEPGEAVVDAMVREFAEETGIKTQSKDWQYYATIEGGDWRVSVFRTHGTLDPQPLTDEKPVWRSIFAPSDKLIGNLRWLIPMALDKDRISGLVVYL
jgi:8-oxo-dGTP pyrophosphatase MutT (NUDIX family)